MALVRADLGTPQRMVCPRCGSGQALRHPIVVIKESSVEVEPWVLITCKHCEYLGKAQAH